MKAGPELNALVAVNVMGDRTYGRRNVVGKEKDIQRSLRYHGYSIDTSWSPSTSIADAFEVVEKLLEDDWECTIDRHNRTIRHNNAPGGS